MLFQAAPHTLESFLPIRNTKKVLDLALQVCQGVNHLHKSNLCYGAFNPNNIFVDAGQRLTLGVKHIYEANRFLKLPVSEGFHASVPFMPPE